MNSGAIGKLLSRATDVLDDDRGRWLAERNGRQIMVICDDHANRMRIMSPVASADELSADDLRTILSANFDRALDAKYALNGKLLWSVFMSPLSELSADRFLDGLDQVQNLADNYGGTYASSDLFFTGDEPEEEEF